MEKKCIDIKDIQNGDVLAENIFSFSGSLIVAKDTILNRVVRNRLDNFNVTQVFIREDDAKTVGRKGITSIAVFRENYNKNVQKVKKIIDNFIYSGELNKNEVENVADYIYLEVNSNDVIKYVLQLRSTDKRLYIHSMNVAIYAMLIGKWLKLPENEIKDLIAAGLLHDIGVMQITNGNFPKKQMLFREEFEDLKKHPIYSYQVCKNIPNISDAVAQAILMHHEREDGSGYPYGIKGEKIGYYAKILAVADAYDMSIFPYSNAKGFTPFEVFREFERVGLVYFDANIVMTFLSNIINKYIGIKVKMNSGEIGEIVAILPNNISKPIVRLHQRVVDLSKQDRLKISEVHRWVS